MARLHDPRDKTAVTRSRRRTGAPSTAPRRERLVGLATVGPSPSHRRGPRRGSVHSPQSAQAARLGGRRRGARLRLLRKPRRSADDRVWASHLRSDRGAERMGSGEFRDRAVRMAEAIDSAVNEKPGARVLSVTRGRMREVWTSRAITEGLVGELVVLEHGASTQATLSDLPHVRTRTVRSLAREPHVGSFDLIYSAGLFDSLTDDEAGQLVVRLLARLKPEGASAPRQLVARIPRARLHGVLHGLAALLSRRGRAVRARPLGRRPEARRSSTYLPLFERTDGLPRHPCVLTRATNQRRVPRAEEMTIPDCCGLVQPSFEVGRVNTNSNDAYGIRARFSATARPPKG